MLSSPRSRSLPPARPSLEPSPPLETNHLLNFECEPPALARLARASTNVSKPPTQLACNQHRRSPLQKSRPCNQNSATNPPFPIKKSIKLNKSHHINRPSSADFQTTQQLLNVLMSLPTQVQVAKSETITATTLAKPLRLPRSLRFSR